MQGKKEKSVDRPFWSAPGAMQPHQAGQDERKSSQRIWDRKQVVSIGVSLVVVVVIRYRNARNPTYTPPSCLCLGHLHPPDIRGVFLSQALADKSECWLVSLSGIPFSDWSAAVHLAVAFTNHSSAHGPIFCLHPGAPRTSCWIVEVNS